MSRTDARSWVDTGLDSVRVVAWGGERARLELHPGGPTGEPSTVIHPVDGRPLSRDFIRHCLEQLSGVGGHVMSPALGFDEVSGFEAAGFETRADLHLLVHDLHALPGRGALDGVTVRRGTPRDADLVLQVDEAAFPPLWHLDRLGLRGALGATPAVRYRVGVSAGGAIVGYAITGRAGRRGYLQRLAVAPAAQRAGLGRHLVADGLLWCRRWRVQRVAVNTQHGNDRALDLYRRMGFVEAATGLRVLERRLPLPSVLPPPEVPQ